MLKYNIRMTLRTIFHDKIISFINLFGLAVGITVCLLIMTWVNYELSYDKFHEKSDRLYKVVTRYIYPTGEITNYGQTPVALTEALRADYPEVEDATIYWRRQWQIKYKNKSFMEAGVLTEPNFLKMFSFPLVKGESRKILTNPNSVLLSESLAKKIFGEEDPIGKTISVTSLLVGDFVVQGIFRDVLHNSHMEFQFLSPFLLSHGGYGTDFNIWDLSDFETYVLLKKGTSQYEFDGKIKGLIKKHLPDSIEELYTVGLEDIHLNSDIWSKKQGSISNIYIFSSIAFLVLIIACINYINLSTARAAVRSKEIGIRKTAGASKFALIKQFFTESILHCLIAVMMALVLIELVLPVFRNLADTPLSMNYGNISTIIILLVIFIITTALSGIYPAFFLSSFKPIAMIKNMFSSGKLNVMIRKALVVFQLIVSIFLIIGVFIISSQLSFIQEMDLGFDKRQIIHLDISSGIARNWSTFREELIRYPQILNVTISNTVPGHNESTTSEWTWEGKADNDKINLSIVGVYYDFIETFGMKMKKGSFFSREHPSDLKSGIVINEEAAKIIGYDNPIGKKMKIGNAVREGRIIGIVKNYHYSNLKEKVGPMVFVLGFGLDTVFIKISDRNIPQTLAYIRDTLQKIAPEESFNYSFLDDTLNTIYTDETRLGKIFKYFSLLAIFVSCLGLYGLTIFTIQRRTKEIAIRKVNGATVPLITGLFLKDILKWIIMSSLISWPLAYYFMKGWLEVFAYRVDLNIISFLLATFIVASLAIITICIKAIKIARSNPVEALRYE